MTTRLSKGRGAGKRGQLVVDQHHQRQASSDLLTNLYQVGKREIDGFGKLYDRNCLDGSVLHVFLGASTTKQKFMVRYNNITLSTMLNQYQHTSALRTIKNPLNATKSHLSYNLKK